MNQGKRTPQHTLDRLRVAVTDLFHPDYTVGFGIAPNLLTFPLPESARGLADKPAYRRWGIAPRPEIIVHQLGGQY
jgi:hypothetical protein